ncbi:MAG: ComEA family DNA-binding protein [Myxococcota bacterium]
MDDRPRFRPERGAADRGAPWSLVLLLGVVTVLLVLRSFWPAPTVAPVLVEVAGDVPHPGLYALAEGTVHGAVVAAGGSPDGLADGPVPAGHRVVVANGHVSIERPSDPVLVSIPIDPNVATVQELKAIPGVGESLASRIVADREAHGPFRTFEQLRRVPGLRADTLDDLEPFLALSEVGPLDLNTATAGELETLPGIGPVLAARIVVDRAENGPYTALSDLARVSGVGPAVLEGLASEVVVTP